MSDYYKEIEAMPPPNRPGDAVEFLVPTNKSLARRVGVAAAWLWVFAGVSAVNLILAHAQAPIRMIVSWFVSEFVFELGRASGPAFAAVGAVFALFGLGGTVFLGFMLRRYHVWAFVVSIVLLALDLLAIVLLIGLESLSQILFHGVALYFLWLGLNSARLYHERKRNGQI